MDEMTQDIVEVQKESDEMKPPANLPEAYQRVEIPDGIEQETFTGKFLGHSRVGITKKSYRPAAEKKARRLAKKMRAMNRRRN
jgi:hypothetical protein